MKNIYLSNLLSKIVIALLIFFTVFATLYINAPQVEAVTTYKQTLKSGIEAFPEQYQILLKQLVEETAHTNWNFQAYYTGIDWNEFIEAEAMHGRNRVYKGLDTVYRDNCNNVADGYYCADKNITAYFADPRNFINERNIFQFLELSYNKELYTKELIEDMIKDYEVFNKGETITFVMSDEEHEKYNEEVTMTFADIIMEAAEKSKMSPISIVAKIIQEVGTSGSASVTGTNETYPLCYNYFNIGAYDGDGILNGLKYAEEEGWHCPYTSIVEGAIFNAKNFIMQGQNTLYFYKFDSVGNKILEVGETVEITTKNLYHQYMTNICDPYNQSARYFATYTEDYNLLDQTLNFIIPVYENMPEYVVKPSTLLAVSSKDLYYAHVSSSLYTRVGPSTKKPLNGVVLYKDDLVLMLDRKVAVDEKGNYWDKVQFWNGSIGYVLSIYLEKFDKVINNVGVELIKKPDTLTPTPTIVSTPTLIPQTSITPTPFLTPVLTPTPTIIPTATMTPTPTPTLMPTPTKATENDAFGYGYANVSSMLNVRKNAAVDEEAVLETLAPNEEFKIVDETQEWYKINTAKGVVGYVFKQYAKKIEYALVKDDTIRLIPNATADMVARYLKLEEYEVKKDDNIIGTDVLGTNYIFATPEQEYNIIKVGDVNGDTKINVIDALLIMKHVAMANELAGNYLLASDVNGDGATDVRDTLSIMRFVVGIKPIEL